jgi:hypothetical protein
MVELRKPVRIFGVRAFVQQAGPVDIVFLIIFKLRRVAERIVHDGLKPSVRRGTECDSLNCGGTIAEGKHLPARQGDSDRAFEFTRRHYRQEQLVLWTQARPECPADVG